MSIKLARRHRLFQSQIRHKRLNRIQVARLQLTQGTFNFSNTHGVKLAQSCRLIQLHFQSIPSQPHPLGQLRIIHIVIIKMREMC